MIKGLKGVLILKMGIDVSVNLVTSWKKIDANQSAPKDVSMEFALNPIFVNVILDLLQTTAQFNVNAMVTVIVRVSIDFQTVWNVIIILKDLSVNLASHFTLVIQ